MKVLFASSISFKERHGYWLSKTKIKLVRKGGWVRVCSGTMNSLRFVFLQITFAKHKKEEAIRLNSQRNGFRGISPHTAHWEMVGFMWKSLRKKLSHLNTKRKKTSKKWTYYTTLVYSSLEREKQIRIVVLKSTRENLWFNGPEVMVPY